MWSKRSPKLPHLQVERGFAGMGERGVSDVVRKRQGFSEILLQFKDAGDCARDLGDLDGVRQPVAEMVRKAGCKDLRLVLEAAEGAGVDDAVAVPLEVAAVGVRRFGIAAAPAFGLWKPQPAKRLNHGSGPATCGPTAAPGGARRGP